MSLFSEWRWKKETSRCFLSLFVFGAAYPSLYQKNTKRAPHYEALFFSVLRIGVHVVPVSIRVFCVLLRGDPASKNRGFAVFSENQDSREEARAKSHVVPHPPVHENPHRLPLPIRQEFPADLSGQAALEPIAKAQMMENSAQQIFHSR